MDIIVFVDNIAHSVSGVNETTTCSQVIYALAHATERKGRFLLLARQRNGLEHRFMPDELVLNFVTEKKAEQIDYELILLQVSTLQQQQNGGSLNRLTHNQQQQKSKNQQQLNQMISLDETDDQSVVPPQREEEEELIISMEQQQQFHQQFAVGEGDEMATLKSAESGCNQPPSHNSSCTTLSEMPSRLMAMGNTNEGMAAANRPPPPAYDQVMGERIVRSSTADSEAGAAASRTPLTFLNIQNFSLRDLYERTFTREELETLIDIQDRILASQKSELLRIESASLTSEERELLQLIKQHNNLRTVLNSLRNGSWIDRLESEQRECERLNTAIAAMKTAIENKGRELYEALQLQKELEMRLELLKQNSGGDGVHFSDHQCASLSEHQRTIEEEDGEANNYF